MSKFTTWCPEHGQEREDGRVFEATDHEHAAQKWAHREDSWGADYLIVSGRSTPTVKVALEGEDPKTFVVSGESVPQYYAREYK